MKILTSLRRRGIMVRLTSSRRIEVSSDTPLAETVKQEIRKNEAAILRELDREASNAVARASAKATMILKDAKPDIPQAFGMEETDGTVYMVCKRRDGSGWTVSIPAESYDPWKLSQDILASAAPEDAITNWRKG